MKLALVFSDYRRANPSGERVVVQNEICALRSAGVEVLPLIESTDEGMERPFYGLRTATRVATGFGRSPLGAIEAFEPDVVHVHNLFPNFGHRWVEGLRCALVVTLHNYRVACAQGSLFRDGSPCTLCPEGSSIAAVRHRCYRDSMVATLPLALAGGLRRNSLVAAADAVVLMSELQRDILCGFGLDRERVELAPNFLPDAVREQRARAGDRSRRGWIYIGRLDEGKGILDLVEGWPEGRELTVVGSGPLLGEVERRVRQGVRVLGQQSPEEVRNLLRTSLGLVFPSKHFEVQPLVYVEALDAGIPIVARAGNAVAEAVQRDGTGTVYTDARNLDTALRFVETRPPGEWGARNRSVVSGRYGEATWTEQRIALYQRLVAQRQPSRPVPE